MEEVTAEPNAQEQVSHIEGLYTPLLIDILTYLDTRSLVRASGTSSTLCILSRFVLLRNPVWKSIRATLDGVGKKASGEVYRRTVERLHESTSSICNTGFLFTELVKFAQGPLDTLASSLHPSTLMIGCCGVSGTVTVDNVNSDAQVGNDFALISNCAPCLLSKAPSSTLSGPVTSFRIS